MVDMPAGEDCTGRYIGWQDLMNRVLDYYDTATVSHQQEVAAYPYVLERETAAREVRYYRMLERGIGCGMRVEISPWAEVQFHNGDGHQQRFLGERGLQTVMTRPGESGGRGRESEAAPRGYGSRR